MSSKKPVSPALHLLTLKGVRMREQLAAELSSLEGPEQEECAVSIADNPWKPGIEVLVQRSVPVLMDSRWDMETETREAGRKVFIYRRRFEVESEEDIARAIQGLFDLPGLSTSSM